MRKRKREQMITQWIFMTLLLQKLQEIMWLYHKVPRQRLACSRGRGGSNPSGSLCASPIVSKMPKHSFLWIYLKESNPPLQLIHCLTIYPQPTRYAKGCHKYITQVYALLLFFFFGGGRGGRKVCVYGTTKSIIHVVYHGHILLSLTVDAFIFINNIHFKTWDFYAILFFKRKLDYKAFTTKFNFSTDKCMHDSSMYWDINFCIGKKQTS